ncbi:MAG TPA: C25 family cysteine peptidase [Burkholderiales bacterium]|nr:C25 family cysteine peptidase [Burkholderiales bacterium]
MATDKAIVTNAKALRAKYGADGFARIAAALDAMIRADAKRGLSTRVVAIDSRADMSRYGKPVASAENARAAKSAIDAIHDREQPDYIMILGASDVVPLVPLKNPVWEPGGDDDDRLVPSDLPYACDAGYSLDANRFVGPTRVVGRLPDLVGARDPKYLLKLLRVATGYKTLPAAAYKRYFGLSTLAWRNSTSQTMTKLFGGVSDLRTAPPKGPKWTMGELSPLAHFINCHGGHRDTQYYGQPPRKEEYPTAHDAALLAGKIKAGTVLAAECCYGAEMYDPAKTQGQAGIAYTYLGEGAYGVFGSTTIAYGPSSGNSSADLICRYFLNAVMDGSSLGRATLEARQQFSGQYSHLSPVDLKTLAQFYLLGDPSVHPAEVTPHALNNTKSFKAAFAKSKDAGPRLLRRDRLRRVGTNLQRTLPATRRADHRVKPSAEVAKALRGAARESEVKAGVELHFRVAPKARAPGQGDHRTVHVLLSANGPGTRARAKNLPRAVAIVATAEGGRLLHLRRLRSR